MKPERLTSEIEMICNEWALWVLFHHEQSPLGYPSETVESKILKGTTVRSGKTGGPKIPEEMLRQCDPRLSVISHGLWSMPSQWAHALWLKHLAPARIVQPRCKYALVLKTEGQRAGYYCETWACSRAQYYNNLLTAYAYIMGLLKHPAVAAA